MVPTDALGSVRLTMGDTGTALSSIDYDPWGQVERGTPARFGFTGELQQGSTVHLRARWYNASSGSFGSVDPYAGDPASPASLAPYMYAYNQPTGFTAPSGRCIPQNVPFIGEAGCTFDAGVGSGRIDARAVKKYAGNVVEGMGLPGAMIADAFTGRHETERILSQGGVGTYLGAGVTLLATLGTATSPALHVAATNFVATHVSATTATMATAAFVAASTVDDAALAYTALTADDQTRADAYQSYQMSAADGNLPFADVLAAGSILALPRAPKCIVKLGAGDYSNAIALTKRFPDAQIFATNSLEEWTLGSLYLNAFRSRGEKVFLDKSTDQAYMYLGWERAKEGNIIVGDMMALEDKDLSSNIADIVYIIAPYPRMIEAFSSDAVRISNKKSGSAIFITAGSTLSNYEEEITKFLNNSNLQFDVTQGITGFPFGKPSGNWEGDVSDLSYQTTKFLFK